MTKSKHPIVYGETQKKDTEQDVIPEVELSPNEVKPKNIRGATKNLIMLDEYGENTETELPIEKIAEENSKSIEQLLQDVDNPSTVFISNVIEDEVSTTIHSGGPELEEKYTEEQKKFVDEIINIVPNLIDVDNSRSHIYNLSGHTIPLHKVHRGVINGGGSFFRQ